MSTLERAYALARSGKYRDVEAIKTRLKTDNYRGVDVLISARSVRGHLAAICSATFIAPAEPAPEPASTEA